MNILDCTLDQILGLIEKIKSIENEYAELSSRSEYDNPKFLDFLINNFYSFYNLAVQKNRSFAKS